METSVFDLTDSKMHGMEMSPDGSRLLYVCNNELLVANLDSGDVVFRCRDPEANYGKAAWSPTGDKAAVCFLAITDR